ncbi:unnamed protein product [Rodentolepis nana]|uniref:G_PROTEIN_RECEP_F1_2 domain-containing protein n=1 Tax=Rodentolepis nana TaxID=102285 RepID=A0A0R3T3A0_RODNA|nr:unnamed protein product [Rodentolepis nana]
MDFNDSASAYSTKQFENVTKTGSIPLVVTFCIITFLTIVGNVLVIAAVLLVHKLRCPSNFLIVSLAASDLLVSIMVMPFATYMEYTQYWGLGEVACDIYINFDVLLCTASILNLCTISIDRYLAVTRPFEYVYKRTPKLMMIMIFSAWVVSVLISVPPTFGFKSKFVPGKCEYSKNFFYQVYACLGAFYIPLIIMLILYGRIVILARRIVRSDRARVASYSGDEKRNSIQNYAESQGTEEDSKSNYLCHCKGCCFVLEKRVSMDSTDKSLDQNSYNTNVAITSVGHSLPKRHSNPVHFPHVNIISPHDSPKPMMTNMGSYSTGGQIHHFSRLPPCKAHPTDGNNNNNNCTTLTEEPANNSDRSSINVGFLTPDPPHPQGQFTRNYRTSLAACGGNPRARSSLLRDRAFSVNIANLQQKPKWNGNVPLFSKQRMSLALHIRKPGIRRSNEAKAIRTLGIIMGVFCICWLSFFIVALGLPLYNYIHQTEANIDPRLSTFFLWLGK